MKLSLVSWNGTNINNGSPFTAFIPRGQMASLNYNPVLTPRADDYPALSSAVKQGSVLVIGIIVAAGNNINTNRELLKRYFFSDQEKHNLIAQDEADSNKQYFRSGIPVRLNEENGAPNTFSIVIQTDYPYWQLVTATADNWAVTSSGDTESITNAGNQYVKPIFTITPTTTKTGGLTYRRYVPIYNNMDKACSLPLDITGGGLDTAALTTAKMQADGDDLRVWMDNTEVYRWLSGMDTAATKVWVNVPLGPRIESTLLAGINGAATTLTFPQTKAGTEFLQALSKTTNQTLLIESEAVVFDPDNIDFLNWQITGVTRGQKDTTAAVHASAVAVRYIEHDLWILYGDATLTAPDVDDSFKPIFDLTSTNGAWAFTNYFDDGLNRPGAWKGEVRASRTKMSYTYTATENEFADPSTVLGLAERCSTDFTVANESATLDWMFSHPCGITNVLYSGRKYRTGSWPGIAGLQYLQPGAVWFTVANETEPTLVFTWEAFGPSSTALGGTYEGIRFVIDGILSSVIDEAALIEFDTVALTFASANLPTIAVGAETAINFFDVKLTNNTTTEYIKFKTMCPVNTALVIDTDSRTAYLPDGRAVPVTLSTNRQDWLNLAPGANTLAWVDVGTVAVTVVVSHRDKNL
jgi:hypothetical protein